MTPDIQATISKWMAINEIRTYFVRNLSSFQGRKEYGSTFAHPSSCFNSRNAG